MGITYCITQPKRKTRFTLVTRWRVQLADIELEETKSGKRLKWVFQTRDKQHTIVGYTEFSTRYGSKCANWVRAVMNKNCLPARPFDLKELIGNEVYCWVGKEFKEDGTVELVAHGLENDKVERWRNI